MPLGSAPVVPAGSVTLVALSTLAARTASGTSDWVDLAGEFDAVTFTLVVTAQDAGAGPGDTLTVWAQQQLDGANADDVVAFQPLADGATTYAQQSAWAPAVREDIAGAVHTLEDGTLVGPAVRAGPLGRRFRARWSIVLAGAGGYTFQVVARLHRT